MNDTTLFLWMSKIQYSSCFTKYFISSEVVDNIIYNRSPNEIFISIGLFNFLENGEEENVN